MEDFPKTRRAARENQRRAARGEFADANEPLGLENFRDSEQMLVARGEKFRGWRGGQFVRREVASAFFEESQRAIIGDDVFGEKILGAAESFRKKSPKPHP